MLLNADILFDAFLIWYFYTQLNQASATKCVFVSKTAHFPVIWFEKNDNVV